MSTGKQQKAKYWPTAKAYAALTTNPDGPMNPLVEDGVGLSLLEPAVLDKGTEADLFERTILDEGMRAMRSWTASEIIEILEDAANILVALRADVWCDFCSGPVVTPVKDAEEASWLHSGGHTFCSKACLNAHDEHRIDAAGNEAS